MKTVAIGLRLDYIRVEWMNKDVKIDEMGMDEKRIGLWIGGEMSCGKDREGVANYEDENYIGK